MSKLKLFLLLVSGLGIIACGNKPNKTAEADSSPAQETLLTSTVNGTDATTDLSTDTYVYDDNSGEDIYNEDAFPDDTYSEDDFTEELASLINEEEASLFMGQVKTAYEKLVSFKDNPDFHQYGFVQPGEYHDWMLEAQNLRDDPINEKLLRKGLRTNELVLLGVEYLESKGQENPTTLMFNEDFKRVLY